MTQIRMYSMKNNNTPTRRKLETQSACKELVVWGSNLAMAPRVRLTRTQASMVKFPPIVYSILIGTILSDA